MPYGTLLTVGIVTLEQIVNIKQTLNINRVIYRVTVDKRVYMYVPICFEYDTPSTYYKYQKEHRNRKNIAI